MNNELYSFLKAVSFIALGVSALSFGVLVFVLIDKAFPDPLQYSPYYTGGEGLTTALAALIVAFPLYLVLMWRLAREKYGRHTKKEEPMVARWMSYIVLVVVAIIILGDFIAVLGGFLRGELTIRFVLKAGTILFIASSIFGYYVWKLQRRKRIQFPLDKILAGAMGVLVVGVVGYGLFVVGTPAQQRLLQLDERRVSDLQSITHAIDSYWERNESLPATFEDLRNPVYYVSSFEDPKTTQAYEYRIVAGQTYELCATFEAEPAYRRYDKPRAPVSERFWEHGIGRTCFEIEISQVLPSEVEPKPIPAR
jgi:hypothetical protein